MLGKYYVKGCIDTIIGYLYNKVKVNTQKNDNLLKKNPNTKQSNVLWPF